MSFRGCCCTACNEEDFTCTETTGRASWAFNYTYEHTCRFEADFNSCYELNNQSANCNDADAEGPYANASQAYQWAGAGIRITVPAFDVPASSNRIETILDMPQSITVSDPPTNAELCDLARWTTTSSPGTCTGNAPSVTLTCAMDFDGRTQLKNYANSAAPDWDDANEKIDISVEAQITSTPDYTFDAKLRKRIPHDYNCPGTVICEDTDCYLDVLYTIGLYNKLQFRVTGTYYQYAADDGSQATPTSTSSYTTGWHSVLSDLEIRQTYNPMRTCDDPSPPQPYKPMRGADDDATASAFTNEIRRAITAAVSEWVAVVSPVILAPAMSLTQGAEPSKSAANQFDLRFRTLTSGYWPSTDDDGLGNINGTGGGFDNITGCSMWSHYTAGDITHERSVSIEDTYTYANCFACTSATNEGTVTYADMDYGFAAAVKLIDLDAENCT